MLSRLVSQDSKIRVVLNQKLNSAAPTFGMSWYVRREARMSPVHRCGRRWSSARLLLLRWDVKRPYGSGEASGHSMCRGLHSNRPTSSQQMELSMFEGWEAWLMAQSTCFSQPMRPSSSLRSLCPGRLTPVALDDVLFTPVLRSQFLKSSSSTPTSSSSG